MDNAPVLSCIYAILQTGYDFNVVLYSSAHTLMFNAEAASAAVGEDTWAACLAGFGFASVVFGFASPRTLLFVWMFANQSTSSPEDGDTRGGMSQE